MEHRLPKHGRGRVVLTASKDEEYSFEGEALVGQQVVTSVFTAGLVNGLATGNADTDRDGLISVEDAFVHAVHYVHDQGGRQTPQKWLYAAEGSIVLAHSPAGKVIAPAPLPEYITASLDSPSLHVRIGAVNELGELMSGPNPALALAARNALEQVIEHDSPRVAAACREILQTIQDDDAVPDQLGHAVVTEPSPRHEPDTRSGNAKLIDTGSATRREAGTRSRGGTLIAAAASNDMTARIWDTATGTHRTTLTGHRDQVHGVAFSPDGASLGVAFSP